MGSKYIHSNSHISFSVYSSHSCHFFRRDKSSTRRNVQESNTVQKDKYVPDRRNNGTHGIFRENFLEDVALTLKGNSIDCPADRGGNGQLTNEGGAAGSNERCDKGGHEDSKNMSHFSENNVCLHRMGQLVSAFANQAVELEVDAVIS